MDANGQQNQGQTGGTGQGGGDAKWYDSLPDDLKGNDALKGFDGVESLAKAHLAAADEITGLKKQIEDSKPVVPEKPEGYELPTKVEGYPDELTAEASGQISRIAHAVGLTKEQASKALAALIAEEKSILEADAEAIKKQALENETALKKEFGDKYAEVMNGALLRSTQIAEKAGMKADDFKAFLDETNIGNNLTFIKFAIGLSKLISPDVFERNDGLGQDGKTAAQKLYPSMSQ